MHFSSLKREAKKLNYTNVKKTQRPQRRRDAEGIIALYSVPNCLDNEVQYKNAKLETERNAEI
jgi:hypothetical protein